MSAMLAGAPSFSFNIRGCYAHRRAKTSLSLQFLVASLHWGLLCKGLCPSVPGGGAVVQRPVLLPKETESHFQMIKANGFLEPTFQKEWTPRPRWEPARDSQTLCHGTISHTPSPFLSVVIITAFFAWSVFCSISTGNFLKLQHCIFMHVGFCARQFGVAAYKAH